MNVLLWLPRALWKMYFFLVFCIFLLLFYPFFYIALSKKSWYKYAFLLKRLFVYCVQVCVGVFFHVRKRAKLPEGPFIICPNHSSYLDITMMYAVFPRYFIFMGKKELERWPLFGIFFKRGMDISVDRQSTAGARTAMEHARKALQAGTAVVIFPEATIPPSAPRMKSFKNGAFKLSAENNVPIVPVTFLNNWKLLQGSKFLKGRARPGISNLVIHDAVFPEGNDARKVIALKNKVFDTINSPLKELYGFQ